MKGGRIYSKIGSPTTVHRRLGSWMCCQAPIVRLISSCAVLSVGSGRRKAWREEQAPSSFNYETPMRSHIKKKGEDHSFVFPPICHDQLTARGDVWYCAVTLDLGLQSLH